MPEKGMKKLVETKPKKIVEQDTDDDMFNMDSMMNMMMMAMMVTIMVQLSPIGRNMGSMSQDIHTYVTGQSYLGKQEPCELVADPTLRIYNILSSTPWTSVVIYNHGSYPAKIGFNGATQMFTVDPGQIYNATRLGATQRIISVYYQCLPTQSTLLRVTGEY